MNGCLVLLRGGYEWLFGLVERRLLMVVRIG